MTFLQCSARSDILLTRQKIQGYRTSRGSSAYRSESEDVLNISLQQTASYGLSSFSRKLSISSVEYSRLPFSFSSVAGAAVLSVAAFCGICVVLPVTVFGILCAVTSSGALTSCGCGIFPESKNKYRTDLPHYRILSGEGSVFPNSTAHV